jgi:membrane associated rhomboid family serine protease
MILPVGHESDTVRRIPWVTISIIFLCVVIHLFISESMKNCERKLETQFVQLFRFYFEHPYLQLDPELKEILFSAERNSMELLEFYRKNGKKPEDSGLVKEQQKQLDEFTGKVKHTIDNIPYRKWGLIPAKKTLTGLLAHMFVHGDWIHLIGNLFLLYLTGPFIEDAWGRSIYLVLYLLMGIFSGLMFAVHYPQLNGPLIGASGAIAGLMGAFLIRFWNTKIKFIYFFIFPIFARGSFKAPAWIMLPIWLFMEFFNAQTVDSINPQGGGAVAHWAHVWGFAFGALVAILIRVFRIEERFVAPKIEAQTSFVNQSFKQYEDSLSLLEKGEKNQAYDLLSAATAGDPSHIEMGQTLWRIGQELGKIPEAAGIYLKVIENEIRMGRISPVLNDYLELKNKVPGLNLSVQSKMLIVRYLIDHESKKEAKEMFVHDILNDIGPVSPPGFLLQASELALKLGHGPAEKIIAITLRHPDIPESRKNNLRLLARQFKRPTGREDNFTLKSDRFQQHGAAHTEPHSKPSGNNKLKITRVCPLEIKNKTLILDIEKMGKRSLPIETIKQVSLAKIAPPDTKPYLIIDLLLDDPAIHPPEIRLLRISSKDFNPLRVIPNEKDPMNAFRIFVLYLAKMGKARVFPDQDSIQFKKFSSFVSTKNYHDFLLGKF